MKSRFLLPAALMALFMLILTAPVSGTTEKDPATPPDPRFSISGKVTDMKGNPFTPSILLMATRKVAPITVMDETPAPVAGAQVFRNGKLAGVTLSNGQLTIPELAEGDKLIARQKLSFVYSGKGHHDIDPAGFSGPDWAYNIYITSLDIPKDGKPKPYTVVDPEQQAILTVKKSNPLIGFNVVASVEWDASPNYLSELLTGFQSASSYLYKASNGQMLFELVTIYDNNVYPADADYQFEASNTRHPASDYKGIDSSSNRHLYLGRYWNSDSANYGSYTLPTGFRTLTHEFAHYGLGLLDSYYYYDDTGERIWAYCTSADIRTNKTPAINATLMDYPYNADQFAMRGVAGLWSGQCENGEQVKVTKQSDWERMRDRFGDLSQANKWRIQTPADHGGVVPGPTAIPVQDWVKGQASDSNTGVCAPFDYQVAPFTGADVYLSKPGGRIIYEGRTDAAGYITILGAAPGDQVALSVMGPPLLFNSVVVDCTAAASRAAEPVKITLNPAPFQIDLHVSPGDSPGAAVLVLTSSVPLSTEPGANYVYLTQGAAKTDRIWWFSYDAALQAYTAPIELASYLSQSGTYLVHAVSAQQAVVEVGGSFGLEPAAIDQGSTARSNDGQVELHFPANSLAGSGQVSINSSRMIGKPPTNRVLLSGPYLIESSSGLTFSGTANLGMYYLHGGDGSPLAIFSTASIYRWDGTAWQPLPSSGSLEHSLVSAPVQAFGSYAVFADKAHSTFLPFTGRDASPAAAVAPAEPLAALPDRPVESGNDAMLESTTLLHSNQYTATTDLAGNFMITQVPTGTYTLEPVGMGGPFLPATRTVQLPPSATGQDLVIGMILIPAGPFQMGCDPVTQKDYGCYWPHLDAAPLHTVNLSPYYIDAFEVTNEMYAKYKSYRNPGFGGSQTRPDYFYNLAYAEYPVLNVTWYEAYDYCRWAGKRLPTEAEWEKAARGSADLRIYPWGDQPPDCTLANGGDPTGQSCIGDTVAVGSYPAGVSPYGVFDMFGNVMEWVNDWWSQTYYSSSPVDDPPGPADPDPWTPGRAIRGADYGTDLYTDLWPVFIRAPGTPNYAGVGLGFRCAISAAK
jgi:formylglycine-generating enzyme